MRQYKSFIQIIIIIIKKNNKSQKAWGGGGGGAGEDGERQRGRGDRFLFLFSLIHLFLRLTEIGPQIFLGAKGKVGLRDKSYA